ncbi:MAG: sensor histidine kinase [Gammaproteobacteria bacterium]|nr:sensor histidine kinase [Gammaproteobacteria bacterium]
MIAASRDPQRVQLQLDSRPQLHTDAKLLRVILTNLIDNALKYGDPTQPIQVRLSGDQPCQLRICNPPGPAGAPDAEQVFEKYYRSPRAHGLTGSGQGLYIAHAFSQMLGGELSYQPGADLICFQLRM